MRRYEEAAPHLDRVTALAPDFAEGYVQRARVLLNGSGDLEGARRILREAEERIPPAAWPTPMLDVARTIYHPELDEFLVRIRPGVYGLDSASYHFMKARMLSQLARKDAAFVHFDSARVRLERMRDNLPDQAWIHSLLGVAYAGMGRPAEAIRSAERAVEMQPVSQDALDGPERLVTLGQVHTMLGNPEKAMEYYSTALALPSYISGRSLLLDPFLRPQNDPRRLPAPRCGGLWHSVTADGELHRDR